MTKQAENTFLASLAGRSEVAMYDQIMAKNIVIAR
jgi:hypothetical protein